MRRPIQSGHQWETCVSYRIDGRSSAAGNICADGFRQTAACWLPVIRCGQCDKKSYLPRCMLDDFERPIDFNEDGTPAFYEFVQRIMRENGEGVIVGTEEDSA